MSFEEINRRKVLLETENRRLTSHLQIAIEQIEELKVPDYDI